jgi:hypothetical protein
MSSPDNSPDDPYLRALIAIGAELTAIRQALEAMGETEGETDSQPATTQATYHCRSCGATVTGDGAARQHAVSDHNAPRDAWSDIMIREHTTPEEDRHAQ